MIKFYYSTAPNPMKVALCLEEMGLSYEPIPVDTRKGQQHQPNYLAINPNAKVPSIVDGETTIFDSNAIVLYLAEKTGKFLPKGAQERGPMLSWLMFVASGIGPSPASTSTSRTTRREDRLRAQPLRVRGAAPLGHRRRAAGEEQVPGGLPTPCRHGVGAGRGWFRNPRRACGEVCQPEAPGRRDQRRPAAQKAIALKDRYTFKTEMDEEESAPCFRATTVEGASQGRWRGALQHASACSPTFSCASLVRC